MRYRDSLEKATPMKPGEVYNATIHLYPTSNVFAKGHRIRVDVFGLGALAFYLLAGRPAARSTAALRDRLREQSGLDLAPELPQVDHRGKLESSGSVLMVGRRCRCC